MTQEMRHKLFSTKKVLITLFAFCLIFGVWFSVNVFSQGEKATVTVTGGSGFVGDKVTIYIQFSDMENLADLGVTGVCGGEIAVEYDPDVIYVDDAENDWLFGSALTWHFSTEFNPVYTPNSFKFAYGHATRTHMNGDVLEVTFTLKEKGTSSLDFVLDEFLLKDQDNNTIPNERFNFVNGTITVDSYELDQVAQPTWNGNSIEWINVANASRYDVRLFKSLTNDFSDAAPVYPHTYTGYQGDVATELSRFRDTDQ